MASTPLGNQGISPVQLSVSSNSTVGTADGTVATLLPGQRLQIQNLDDAALHVKYGASCSTTDFTFIIPACTAANDGTVPPYIVDNWIGVVSVAAATGTARYLATVLS
jgi:hypothetical protein